MTRQPISIEKFIVKPQPFWEELLLASGNLAECRFNAMTIGWGSLGVMWGIPFVQVVVRPTRYTYEYMEKYDTFTICAFPKKYHQALQLLGTKSGRDGDKIAEAGLTPIPSAQIAAPSFAQAKLVLECRKIYWDDMQKDHFLDEKIGHKYPNKDYHRIYYGEILVVMGNKRYKA